MYTDILYPTDGSPGANAALEHVRDLAERHDATVHVLTVVNSRYIEYQPGMMSGESKDKQAGMMGDSPNNVKSGMIRDVPENMRSAVKERAEGVLEEAAAHLEGVKSTREIRVGDPHDVILSYTNSNEIDIVVMGTHGRSGLDRYLIGSVAEKVVRLSDVPVVTVRSSQ
ncbi:universal stress protein [Natrialbaceae archaeon A-chndr2]